MDKALKKMSRWSHSRYCSDRNSCVLDIRCEISCLVSFIKHEVGNRQSLAMLGEMSLAPFLEEDG